MSFEASMNPLENKLPTKKNSRQVPMVKYRLMVLSRFVLAIFGGYYLAAIFTMLVGTFFHTEPLKSNTVLAVTMFSFVIYCAVFFWIFMVNSTKKAWLGIVIPSVVMTLAYFILKG